MKKLILISLFILSGCYTEPQFKTANYQSFGSSKYPPIIVTVNSAGACGSQTGCNYTNNFVNELKNTGAFENVDITNPGAEYRVKITFHASGLNRDSLYVETRGILPSDVKQNFTAVFELEDANHTLYTYNYNATGVKTAHAFIKDNGETMKLEAIKTFAGYFVANLQRDNVLPMRSNY
jgi:hypothetical protein